MSAVIGGVADPVVPGRKGLNDHRQPGRSATAPTAAIRARGAARPASPAIWAIRSTRVGDSSRNTPTVTISGGSRLTMSAAICGRDLAR